MIECKICGIYMEEPGYLSTGCCSKTCTDMYAEIGSIERIHPNM